MPPRSASRKGPAPGPIAPRFWAKVNKQGPLPEHDPSLGRCWLWTSSIHKSGYALFFMPGSVRNAPKARAHRVSYQLAVGEIPDGLDILHRCDVRRCVNPAHLYLGTDVENARDRVARGREGDRSGSKNGRVKLTPEQVDQIRAGYREGASQEKLAQTFGVSQGQVSRIIRGVQWK